MHKRYGLKKVFIELVEAKAMKIKEIGIGDILQSVLLTFKREKVAEVEPGSKLSCLPFKTIGNSIL